MWKMEILRTHSQIKLIFYKDTDINYASEDSVMYNAQGSITIDESEIEKWKAAIDFLNKQN